MSTLTSPVDIRADHLEIVQDILCTHLPAGFEVWVFGSRANWTTKDSSDLDLAVEGVASLDHGVMVGLEIAFEESNLPYTVDVVDLNAVSPGFKRIVEDQRVLLPSMATSHLPDKKIVAGRHDTTQGWHQVNLGDIAEIFDGTHATPKKTEDGPVFLGISNLVNGRIDISTAEHLSDSDYATWTKRVIPQPGDIVFSYETRLGEAAAIPPGLQCCLGRRMGLLRVSKELVDPQFLLYAYLGPEFQGTLQSRTVQGSTVDRILLTELGTFPIRIPLLPEQRAIAHILGTLDDKIELNRRMNQTLEAMARAIFQDWFVDFGPVRAKMEGSDPYLPPELWDLFPEDLMDSELGEIPEGWEVGVLHDIVELLSGGTPRTSVPDYWDGNIPWYTPKDAPDPSDIFALSTERSITQAGVDNSSTKVLPTGTTIISARGTVGRLACLGVPMAMNQTCYGIRGACGYPDHFTYWNIKNSVNGLLTKTHGTIFDTITRETFQVAETILVPTQVALSFESTVNDLMGQIRWNLKESRCLAAQRDVLLPKLVSGELKIRDIALCAR